MAANKHLDPYQDIEAYLARAQKEIGDAFDDIVMRREVEDGHDAQGPFAVTEKNNNNNNWQKKVDRNCNARCEKYSNFELNHYNDLERGPPCPPPRFHSLLLDNRMRRWREELLQSRKALPRSFRNMSCPARARFLDDLAVSLIRNNRTMSLSDGEEPEVWWRSRRRSSLPSPSDEFPFERCGRVISGSLDRPIIRKRVILNGRCFEDEKRQLPSLDDHVTMAPRVKEEVPELKTLSNTVGFDEIAAFVDSVVQQVNSLSVDEELDQSAKENLAKLASYFPPAKLRAKQLPKYKEKVCAEPEPDYESIGEENDDVFDDVDLSTNEDLSINEDRSVNLGIIDVIMDRKSGSSSSLSSPSIKRSELVNKMFHNCLDRDNSEEISGSVDDDCKSEDQFQSLTDSGEFRKSNGSLIKDFDEKNVVHQKKCDLGEFLKQVESSIRESNGTSSPSFLSAQSDVISSEDISGAILVDAATQTTPRSLSRSTSFSWLCDCQCGHKDCKHRQSVIWEEDSPAKDLTTPAKDLTTSANNLFSPGNNMLDGSVNDMLSAIGSMPASVEELMKIDGEEEEEDGSSGYSLSASLDNVSAGHVSSEDESLSLTSASDGNDTCFKANRKCLKSVDVATSPFCTLAKPDQISKGEGPKPSKGPKERLSHSLDHVKKNGEFSGVLVHKESGSADRKQFSSDRKQFSGDESVSRDENGCLSAVQCDWLNCNKSFSAPVLGCTTQCTTHHSSIGNTSPNEAEEIKELEAVEACKWLRAAGFPQYAQMFEDMQFPIDVSAVQKDHYFLDHDSLQSLFRRLNALNRCARMRLDNLPRKINGDDSDEENQCALSENWKFQRQSRRWSRIPGNLEAMVGRRNSSKDEWYEAPEVEVEAEVEQPATAVEEAMEDGGSSSASSPPASDSPLKRSGSERLKDGAKALLRRVESLKSRRSKRKNREVVVISGPQLLDVPPADEPFPCLQVTPPDTHSAGSSPSPTAPPVSTTGRKKGRRFFGGGGRYRGGDECSALSDSECSPTLWRSGPPSPTAKCYIEHFLAPDSPQHHPASDGINYRTGSFNLGVDSGAYRERFKEPSRGSKRDSSDLEQDRNSVYDNVPVVIFNRGYADDTLKPAYHSLPVSSALSGEHKGDDSSINEVDSGSATSTVHDVSDREGRSPTQSHLERRDSGVGLSLTRSDRSQSIWQTSVKCHRPSIPCRSVPLNELSSGQIMVIRKLALLKLTALMERYSPSNRSGWNWAMPKFIKRMKTPEYKDKMVFGVPLVVVLQRSGQPLPPSIQNSIRYIRKSAIDAVGIFRKSGVRSRIQKLKGQHESNPGHVVYDDLQPYDVADLLKQYFRELPEALLTNKMSETFISIYQHVAEEARLEALQAAVVLLPDENREVLQALLCFLNDVANRSNENQMTASNLAVCFAPSLFHMNCPRSQSTSPRRRKTVGVPDQRELSENRAAHECLTHMICDFSLLFSIPDDILAQVRCPYMDQWQPPSMEQVLLVGGSDHWKASVEADVQWLLKESKEKFKSWVQLSTNDGTDLAYKKVGDGNPLRTWKVAVEIEAPPAELLNSLLRERHLWDSDILKWRVIERLNKQTEVFQYVYNSMSPLPARDYAILRSWRTDLPKGTCVLIESSVDHPDASTLLGGVRGVVLVSRYLIEPCGSGKSRLTHVSRVDTRGRSPEWYNKVYGHVSCCHVTRLRDSLHHSTEGPESKV